MGSWGPAPSLAADQMGGRPGSPADFFIIARSLQQTGSSFSMSNCLWGNLSPIFILFQETSVVWSDGGSQRDELSHMRSPVDGHPPHPQFGLLWGMWVSRDGVGHSAPGPACQPAGEGSGGRSGGMKPASGATENTGLAGRNPDVKSW